MLVAESGYGASDAASVSGACLEVRYFSLVEESPLSGGDEPSLQAFKRKPNGRVSLPPPPTTRKVRTLIALWLHEPNAKNPYFFASSMSPQVSLPGHGPMGVRALGTRSGGPASGWSRGAAKKVQRAGVLL